MSHSNYENTRFLDIVNLEDQIIDAKSRAEVHRLGLLHREIHVWMFDKNHCIFFQKRGLHRPSAGLLDATVGGHVNKGEDYVHAAVRETKEETSIKILPSDLVLLKTLTGAANRPEGSLPGGSINNFIRQIYIYKHPIEDAQIKKEAGILGVDFQKISPDFLKDAKNKDSKIFGPFIFAQEVPDVLQYLQKTPL